MPTGGYTPENKVRVKDGLVGDQTGRRQRVQGFESPVEDPGRGRNLEFRQSFLNE